MKIFNTIALCLVMFSLRLPASNDKFTVEISQQDEAVVNIILSMQEAINLNQQAQQQIDAFNGTFGYNKKNLNLNSIAEQSKKLESHKRTSQERIKVLRANHQKQGMQRPTLQESPINTAAGKDVIPQLVIEMNQCKASFARLLDEYLAHFGQLYEKKAGLLGAYQNIPYISSCNSQTEPITLNEHALFLAELKRATQQSDWGKTVSVQLPLKNQRGLMSVKSLNLNDIISAISQVTLPANYSTAAIIGGVATAAAIGATAYYAYTAMNQPAASTPATDTVPATSVLDTAPIVATHVIASSIAPTTGTVPVTSAPIILAPVIIPPVNHETVDSSSVTSNVSALNTIFGTPEQQAQDATTRLAQQASTPELSWWEQRDKDGYEYFTTDPKTWASSTGTSVFNTIFGTPAIIPTDVAVSATPARDITPVTQPAPVSTAVTAQVTSVIPPVAVAALGTTALSLGSTKKEATPTTNQAPQRSWSEFGTEMKNNAKTELAGYYNAAFTPEEQAAFEAAQQPKALQLKADQEKYVAEIKARDEAFNKEQDALAAQEKIDKDNKDEAIRKTNKETGTYLYNTIFGTPEYQAQQAAQQKAAQLQQATNWLIENNKFTDQQLSSMTPEQVINQYQTLKLEAIRKNKPTFSINAVSKIAPQQNTRSAIPKSAISPIIETPNFVLSVRPQTMLSALEAKPTFTPPSISTDPNNFSSSSETVD